MIQSRLERKNRDLEDSFNAHKQITKIQNKFATLLVELDSDIVSKDKVIKVLETSTKNVSKKLVIKMKD